MTTTAARRGGRELEMHHFRAFGGVLASELHFPELRPAAPSPPDWTLRVGAAEVPSVAQSRLRVAITEQSGMDKVTFTILRDGKTHDLTYLIRDR